MLASEIFTRAPSLGQFLRYVCTKALSGEADQITEYRIAVEALGRPAEFNGKEDAIVRVEASHLRRRLARYYESEGANHAVQIAIPPGKYVPRFIIRSAAGPVKSGGAGRPRFPISRRLRIGILIAVAAVLAAWSAAFLLSESKAGRAERAPSVTAPDTEDGIRIAAGLDAPDYVDTAGRRWLGDRWFSGGRAASSPDSPILRTRDSFLFRHRREGCFRYAIPLPAGAYELHLLFAERVWGPGNPSGGGESSRLFHVYANDRQLLSYFDVLAEASGPNTAHERVFTNLRPAPDGFLHLRFEPYKDQPFVNAILLLPAAGGRMRTLRMRAGDASYRDKQGNVWRPDDYWLGGRTVERPLAVSGTEDPVLYQSERYGNFSYAIPVAPGRYAVTLHFSEHWWGPGKPAAGGAGSRVFNVQCNGVTLLQDFDIFKAVGADRAERRTFHGLTPDAQGKLILTFTPVANYACVNAIEVVDEGE